MVKVMVPPSVALVIVVPILVLGFGFDPSDRVSQPGERFSIEGASVSCGVPAHGH